MPRFVSDYQSVTHLCIPCVPLSLLPASVRPLTMSKPRVFSSTGSLNLEDAEMVILPLKKADFRMQGFCLMAPGRVCRELVRA